MVLAEAMAFGTPVVATDLGGVADLVGRGPAGIVLPAKAGASDWAAAVRRMTISGDLYDRRSKAAFERARGDLSWSRWAETIERLAREALAGQPARLAAE